MLAFVSCDHWKTPWNHLCWWRSKCWSICQCSHSLSSFFPSASSSLVLRKAFTGHTEKARGWFVLVTSVLLCSSGLPKLEVCQEYYGLPPPPVAFGPPLRLSVGDIVELSKAEAEQLWWQVRIISSPVQSIPPHLSWFQAMEVQELEWQRHCIGWTWLFWADKAVFPRCHKLKLEHTSPLHLGIFMFGVCNT